MPSENEKLPMTADDVTHLFRSTEKCKPGTRGANLNALAGKVLTESLNTFLTENHSPDPSSSAPASSSSHTAEDSLSSLKLTLEGLTNRYRTAHTHLENNIMPKMLEPYVNPGAAILENDLPAIIQSIYEAEVMHLGNHSCYSFSPEAISFVRGFLCGRGFDEYFK